MSKLQDLLAQGKPVIAPLVWDPLTAILAAAVGFPAAYLGGGAVGYVKAVTEANLTLTEMVQAGLEIRSVSPVPLILDAACGWGEPMHVQRTMRAAEAAGFAAIEIEDQLFPKRAHHHVGIEHLVPADEMCAKIREAVAVRGEHGPLIIARTNAARSEGLDEAARRAKAYRAAGAEILFVLPKDEGQLPVIAREVGGPLMHMALGDGLRAMSLSPLELYDLGYVLIVDPGTPLWASFRALHAAYRAMAGLPVVESPGSAAGTMRLLHEVIGLEALLDAERRTVEH